MSQFKDIFGRLFYGKKISMLGLKHAGKSQFLKSLGCEEAKPGVETQKDSYNWFKVKLQDKSIYIKAGYDFGGGHEQFVSNFAKAITSGAWVLFLIDMKLFMENGVDLGSGNSYRDVVFARLDYINENTSRKYFDKIAIVLTHADLLKDSRKTLCNEFQKETHHKSYSVLTKRCFSINAKNKSEVLNAFARIIS